MMMDENLARFRAHRNNVLRYRRLLATRLTDLERAYIERRLEEELASMDALSQDTFPPAWGAACTCRHSRRGSFEVVGHYLRMRDSASSELERRSLQRRMEEESPALEHYLKTRLRGAQAVA